MAPGSWEDWMGKYEQQAAAQALASMQAYSNSIWSTTATANTNYYGVISAADQVLSQAKPAPKPPETALEWLDRRVQEMRVRL